jgi:transposase-like protein
MPNARDNSSQRTERGPDQLPPPDTKRWTAQRKAAVVEAVRSGVVAIEEICRRYDVTAEEFLSWHNTMLRHGVWGLYTTALQKYRYSRADPVAVKRKSAATRATRAFARGVHS